MNKKCIICKENHNTSNGSLVKNINKDLLAIIKKDYPDLAPEAFICFNDILNYRLLNIEKQLKKENLKAKSIDHDILKSIHDDKFISRKIEEDDKDNSNTTIGQRVADGIAKFGGSWIFIFTFMAIILFWIIINSIAIIDKHFDPYPFILLNLVLSCLAAIQAPVIMMSQNRQEERDRKQSKNDYKVNLKSEVEVRLLHEKMNHLIYDQMKHLQEVQDIQISLLNELRSEINENTKRINEHDKQKDKHKSL